jgi:hypothetical protein
MAEHVAAQIGDDALAQRGHEVVARGARQRQHGRNRDHNAEIAVDQAQALAGETKIDHAAHRERNRKRGQCRDHERAQSGCRTAAIAPDIGNEGGQWPQLGLADGLWRARSGLWPACGDFWLARGDLWLACGGLRLRRGPYCLGGPRRRALDNVHGTQKPPVWGSMMGYKP